MMFSAPATPSRPIGSPRVPAACPELRATAEHVREFADLMNKHRGDRLTDWIHRIQTDPLPALHSLDAGIRRDLDAVVAGLTPTGLPPRRGCRMRRRWPACLPLGHDEVAAAQPIGDRGVEGWLTDVDHRKDLKPQRGVTPGQPQYGGANPDHAHLDDLHTAHRAVRPHLVGDDAVGGRRVGCAPTRTMAGAGTGKAVDVSRVRTGAVGLVALALLADVPACATSAGPRPGVHASTVAAAGGGLSTIDAADPKIGVPLGLDDPFSALGLTATQLPADALLVGPHFGVRFDGYATTNQLAFDQLHTLGLAFEPDGGMPLRAGAGREFLLVHAVEKPPIAALPGLAPDGDPAPTWTVSNGGAAHPLARPIASGEVLVVNVAAGEDPVLTVTSYGRPQSLGLRSGRRHDDAIALYYPRLSASADYDEWLHIDGPGGSHQTVPMPVSIDMALQPYVDGRGWASPGRAWLDVLVVVGSIPNAALALDLVHTLSLRGPDGRALAVPAGSVLTTGPQVNGTPPGGSLWIAVDVPASLRQVAVAYATVGAITMNGQPVHFSRTPQHNGGTVTLHP
jgi:hypothetical protein